VGDCSFVGEIFPQEGFAVVVVVAAAAVVVVTESRLLPRPVEPEPQVS
jgi:hypothetical protein